MEYHPNSIVNHNGSGHSHSLDSILNSHNHNHGSSGHHSDHSYYGGSYNYNKSKSFE